MANEKRKVGKYSVVSFLGQGGMGAVYKGYDEPLDRFVAIKELKPDGVGNAKAVQRFYNEARIQATLHHPNIATLYEFLEEHGQSYIVMEYVDGVTLEERLKSINRLSVPEVLDVFHNIVLAVNYLHAHGITHRDLKLNNIKLNSELKVKLLDFGIAKQESVSKLTTTGRISGTPAILSPEQIMYGDSDNRTDIWQLGILFYELLTGVSPFDARTIEELCTKILRSSYPSPSSLNPAISRPMEELIARCLKKDPAQRYQSVQDLLADVEKQLSQGKSSTSKSSTRQIVVRVFQIVSHAVTPAPSADSSPLSGKRLLLPLASLTLSAIAIGLVWWQFFSRESLSSPEGGRRRIPIYCSDDKSQVFRLVNDEMPRLIGICGRDQMYVDAFPGEMIKLQLVKDGVPMDNNPVEVTDRLRDISLDINSYHFVKDEQ